MKIYAYIMINVQTGKTPEVFENLKKIKGMQIISVTAGEYDIIARVEVNSLEELYDITNKIHAIKGISRTITLVVEKEYQRRDK